MPWRASEAKSHTKKADTPAKQKKWATIANAALKSGKGDAYAIRTANAAMGDAFWLGDNFQIVRWLTALDEGPDMTSKRRRTTERDKFGRLTATYESSDALFIDRGPAAVLPAVVIGATFYDTFAIEDADPRYKVSFTEDGVMKAMPRIARSCVQEYSGLECGLVDMDRVRVFRPPSSVFDRAAMKLMTHIPVTNDHPREPVTTDNWAQYAVGETGEDVVRDGEAIRVPMMVRDARAIADFKSGKKQLSVGYTCDLAWEPGMTERGEHYDAVQKNIRANHLAIVAEARGGPTLSIGDRNHKEIIEMNASSLRNITIDGIEVQMTDTAASVVQRTLKGLQDQISAMLADKKKRDEEDDEQDECDAKLKEDVKAKDAKIVTLEKQLSDAIKDLPAKIDAGIKAKNASVDRARQIMGAQFAVNTDGKSAEAIRREVVNAKVGDKAKDWGDNEITAAFESLQPGAPSTPNQPGGYQDAVRVFAGSPGPGYRQMTDAELAYNQSFQEMCDAWKPPQQRVQRA